MFTVPNVAPLGTTTETGLDNVRVIGVPSVNVVERKSQTPALIVIVSALVATDASISAILFALNAATAESAILSSVTASSAIFAVVTARF